MITASGLSKVYGDRTAVDGISFALEPGRVTGFLGPNGAGKSTTMRLAMGLDRPSAGQITINGRPFAKHRAPLREVGAVLDAGASHPGWTGQQQLRILAATHAIPKARVQEVIEMTGLSSVANRRIRSYSLGMRQRLGIAAALLGDPGVLIFDEPINGLDPEGVRWVRQLVRRLAAQGRTVFVSSHLMSEMAQTADHLIVIGRGRLVADTTVDDFITGNSAVSTVVRPADTAAMEAALAGAGIRFTRGSDGAGRPTITVDDHSCDEIGALAYQAGVQLSELTERRASLEDAYIQSTEGLVQYQATPKGDGTRA